MFVRDQNLLTWTDSAIYILTPHSGQVLLWTEVKGEITWVVQNAYACSYGCLIINFYPVVSISVLLFVDVMDIAVLRNELFCLHDDGHLSHLSLLSPERCAERLMKRENWTLAATVCCMFQHAVIASRVHTHTVFIFSLITGYWWNSVESLFYFLFRPGSLSPLIDWSSWRCS